MTAGRAQQTWRTRPLSSIAIRTVPLMQCGIFSCEFGRWRRRGWEGCVPSRYPQHSDQYSLCVLPAGRLCWPLPPVRKEKILRHSVTMGSAGLMMILIVVFFFSRCWSSSVISADPPINDRPVIGEWGVGQGPSFTSSLQGQAHHCLHSFS